MSLRLLKCRQLKFMKWIPSFHEWPSKDLFVVSLNMEDDISVPTLLYINNESGEYSYCNDANETPEIINDLIEKVSLFMPFNSFLFEHDFTALKKEAYSPLWATKVFNSAVTCNALPDEVKKKVFGLAGAITDWWIKGIIKKMPIIDPTKLLTSPTSPRLSANFEQFQYCFSALVRLYLYSVIDLKTQKINTTIDVWDLVEDAGDHFREQMCDIAYNTGIDCSYLPDRDKLVISDDKIIVKFHDLPLSQKIYSYKCSHK